MRPEKSVHGPWLDRFSQIVPQPRRLTFTTCSACGTNLPWLGEKKIPDETPGERTDFDPWVLFQY